jgi:hypothetical protein
MQNVSPKILIFIYQSAWCHMPEYRSLQCLQILCNKQKFKNQKKEAVQHCGDKDIGSFMNVNVMYYHPSCIQHMWHKKSMPINKTRGTTVKSPVLMSFSFLFSVTYYPTLSLSGNFTPLIYHAIGTLWTTRIPQTTKCFKNYGSTNPLTRAPLEKKSKVLFAFKTDYKKMVYNVHTSTCTNRWLT